MNQDIKKHDFYKEAGVDIEKADDLVDWLKDKGKKECRSMLGEIVSGIGGFSGLFKPFFKNFEEPLLVASTDGVGTKLLLAIENDKLDDIGIDLVAMCVNDLYCVGAQPLFFLDYYATGVLDSQQFKTVLTGIKKGLSICETVLLGGETAELPGLYKKGEFDLAGFVVGVVDAKKTLGPQNVKDGDKLIAFQSSGFHSNGYSLIRKWISENSVDNETLGKLLSPTKIYSEIPLILNKIGTGKLHALAHITGGGISGNLPRVVPKGFHCHISKTLLPSPKWMVDFISRNGATTDDVEHVFNLGVGMIAVVDSKFAEEFLEVAANVSLFGACIGEVRAQTGEAKVVYE